MPRHPVRRFHNILGFVIGVQLLLWTLSGLFFTVFPLEQIHGTTLRAPVNHGVLALGQVEVDASAASEALASHAPVKSAELAMFFGETVWRLEVGKTIYMVSARTGEIISPISLNMAKRVGAEGIKPKAGVPGTPWLMEANAPREYKGPLPAYVVDYENGGIRAYIDANTGDLVTVRSRNWRIFDVMWRIHIMDITGADKVHSWWMRLFSFLSLALAVSGLWLVINRIRSGTLLR
jgi:uncharacterized iron-regulated membrane protein